MTVRIRVLAVGVGLALAVSACAHRTVAGRTVYKTVTASPTPSTPTPTPSPTTSPVARQTTRSQTTHSTPPPQPQFTRLPGTCKTLMNADSISAVLGHPLHGSIAYSVGRPDPTIGRLANIDCRYGNIRGKAAAVEISVSLYRTAAQAYQRVQATVQDFEAHGASASTAKIADQTATLLLGANLLTYGPTIVKVAGQRTIAVTVRPEWDDPHTVLPPLAGLALRKTKPSG